MVVIAGLLLAATGTIAFASASQLAQFLPQDVSKREVHTGGGWALSTSTCPVGTAACSDWCCPNSLTCVSTPGGVIADVCCEGTSACTDSLEATPFCADSAWTLWNSTGYDMGGGYFCCEKGQRGTDQGDCVDADTVVASTLAAQLLVSGTGKADTAAATGKAQSSSTEAAAAATTVSGGLIGSLVSSAKSDISSIASDIGTKVSGHLASATGSGSGPSATSSSGAGSVGAVENMGVWGFMGGVAALAAAVV